MRQIIAMGGGGFSTEPQNPALDNYVLSQAGVPRPKVCFVPSASGDAENYVLRFFEAFTKLDCQPSYLSLFKLPTADIGGFLLEHDVIYVGGGNTRSMLALWREWEVNKILAQAYEEGVVLAGISAGANCWFEQCSTDSVPGELGMLPCLGLLPGSFCPHYDGEPERRPSFHRLMAEDRILPGLAADDGAAVHFVDGELKRAISSREESRVYRVRKTDEGIVEEEMGMKYLG